MTGSSTDTPSEHTPSVLVVLVVRDAAGWLRGCLSALGAQTYPRMGVLAVDNASTDGSRDILIHALGERRVIVIRPGSRPRGIGAERARDPRRTSVRLPLGAPRRHRPGSRRRDASGRGGDRHARRERRGRGSEGRRLGRTSPPPRRRQIRRSLRAPLHPAAAGGDRSRAVRPGDRSPVRPHVRHADLARGVAADGAVRRAPGHPARGARLLLARAAGRVPRADDAARSRPSSRRDRRRGARGPAATTYRSVLRGTSGHRRDAQELRAAVAPVGAAAGRRRSGRCGWCT